MTEAVDIEIRAPIRRIIWREGGRVIAAVESAEHGKLSVIGEMVDPAEGCEYVFVGKLGDNPRFRGEKQLKLSSYRTILPATEPGIWRYLTLTMKWVDANEAHVLLGEFGPATLETIRDNPGRVAADTGFAIERVRGWSETLSTTAAEEAALAELNAMLAGVVATQALRRAVKRFGRAAAKIIRHDPFKLGMLAGVGWATADRVWTVLDKDPNARRRHVHAYMQSLSTLVYQGGHTQVYRIEALAEAERLLGGPVRDDAERVIDRLSLTSKDHAELVSPAWVRRAEEYLAGKIARLREFPKETRLYPEIPCDGLASDQAAAVAAGAREPVFALIGPPGTGKTYTLARIVKALQRAGCEVALCAPTGKAAKQMTLALRETCGLAASTIHSLLEPNVDADGNFTFNRGEHLPLEADVLVVDEFSMVDVKLAQSLLKAIPPGKRVLIVGDRHQLPSIGPGALLRDLIDAGVPHFELREIKRNAGSIVHACHAIKDGHMPRPCPQVDVALGANWRHVSAGTADDILAAVERLYRSEFSEFDLRWGVQLISPTNESGDLSCKRLNELVRPIVNAGFEPSGRLSIAVGDKVVRTKNSTAQGIAFADEHVPTVAELRNRIVEGPTLCDQRVVNGDVGEIVEISKQHIWVWFRWPERLVRLNRDAHELRLAYCMTCHRLQGSEVQVAVIPLHEQLAALPLWTREWLYTAMSRAKTLLVTVGDINAIEPAVRNTGMRARRTGLVELIRRMCQP